MARCYRHLQLSGVLFRTTVLRNLTLVLPVAIPPPPEPLLNLITLPVSDVVPRLEMPPPRPPATLPENDVPKMRDMPASGRSEAVGRLDGRDQGVRAARHP
jgi:hypothetical protein